MMHFLTAYGLGLAAWIASALWADSKQRRPVDAKDALAILAAIVGLVIVEASALAKGFVVGGALLGVLWTSLALAVGEETEPLPRPAPSRRDSVD